MHLHVKNDNFNYNFAFQDVFIVWRHCKHSATLNLILIVKYPISKIEIHSKQCCNFAMLILVSFVNIKSSYWNQLKPYQIIIIDRNS